MSDFTSPLASNLLAAAQADAWSRANELFLQASQAMLFARRASTSSGLTWGHFGGRIPIDGLMTSIANGTVTLTASATNFVEVSRTGAVSVATSRSADKAPLYQVVTNASAPTDWLDERDPRELARLFHGKFTLAMADANKTLTQAQALCDSMTLTGALTALRDVIVPAVQRAYTVFANVTGGFGIRVIAASGTGITIADGKRAIVEFDGTNVVRVTADV